MKRRFLIVLLVAAILFGIAPYSMAFDTNLFTDGNNEGNIAGLIDLEDTGDYIVMLQIRLRELGYFHFKPTGRYQGMTRNAVIKFQTRQSTDDGKSIISDGTIGAESANILFSARAVRNEVEQRIPIGPKADGSQTQKGERMEWAAVKSLLQQGSTYTLTDFNTGVTFQMTYAGGENHAEMECKTPDDTAVYKKTFGEAFNFSKRPMLISLSGKQIACSLQGEPHGDDSVSGNDMTGHACLFFYGSKSHVGNLVDVEHNSNVVTAAE